jgi:hypothetical protein
LLRMLFEVQNAAIVTEAQVEVVLRADARLCGGGPGVWSGGQVEAEGLG